MKNYQFKSSFINLIGSISGILLFIYPIYKRYSEQRDYFFIIMYCFTILILFIDIIFKLIKPIVFTNNGILIFHKYFFFTRKIIIQEIIEIKEDNSDIYFITNEKKLKIDAKDIQKIDRVNFMKFINEIKINNNI
jgi:hypothetical protein